jgi:hypothetical protein
MPDTAEADRFYEKEAISDSRSQITINYFIRDLLLLKKLTHFQYSIKMSLANVKILLTHFFYYMNFIIYEENVQSFLNNSIKEYGVLL